MKVVYVVVRISVDKQQVGHLIFVEAFRSEHKNKAKETLQNFLEIETKGKQGGKRYGIIEEYVLID